MKYCCCLLYTSQPIPKAANRSHLIIAFSDNFVIELLKTQRIYFKGKYVPKFVEPSGMNQARVPRPVDHKRK